DRARQRARRPDQPPLDGHGPTRRAGAPPQRTARAHHRPHAHLRAPGHHADGHTTAAWGALNNGQWAQAHAETSRQDPNRVTPLGEFLIWAVMLVPALLV